MTTNRARDTRVALQRADRTDSYHPSVLSDRQVQLLKAQGLFDDHNWRLTPAGKAALATPTPNESTPTTERTTP